MNFLSKQEVPRKFLPRRWLFWACALLMLGFGAFLVHGARENTARDARTGLGGDVEIRLVNQLFFLRADAFMRFNSRSLSRNMDMHTVAQHEEERVPIILKGIDRAYPLYGEMRFKDGAHAHPFARLPRQKVWGAAVEQELLNRLGIKPGARIQVGATEFETRAVIESEPDRGDSPMPLILVSREAFIATGLSQAGAETRYRYRLTLPEGLGLDEWRQRLDKTFPNARWEVIQWPELVSSNYRLLSLLLAGIAAAWLIVLLSFLLSCYRCGKR
jgi:putative ABC transport system permease protein